MKYEADKEIKWTQLELTAVLEDEHSSVYLERANKHLGLHPFHLTNLQAAFNEILGSTLNFYDRELKGFVLVYKNPKLLSALGDTFHDSCFIHVDIEADFYIFRPEVGCSLKGIVNKKGLDHIVVLVHKIFTVSIPKPDNVEAWPGDSIEVGQEVKCHVTYIDKNSRLPFICATLNSDCLQGCRLPTNIYNVDNIDTIIEENNVNNINQVNGSTVAVSENDTVLCTKRKKSYKRKRSQENDLEPNFNTDNKIELADNINDFSKDIKCENKQQDRNTKYCINVDRLNDSEFDNTPKKRGKDKKLSKLSDSELKDYTVKVKVEADLDGLIEENSDNRQSYKNINNISNESVKMDKSIKSEDSIEHDNSFGKKKKKSKKHIKKSKDSDSEPTCKIKNKEKIVDNVNNISKVIKNEEEQHHIKREMSSIDTLPSDSDYNQISKKPKKRKTSLKISDLESESKIAKIKVEKV